ncbi:DNA-binding transcriptional regulator, MarR family [Lentzea xinjiangensis]|uniref:DNA-binding transcriptional regulator, MarR family n=1 Tax=Lentzea xinjiangensis TaxID=402600 RepID=A0A1H9WUZ5_9PSEU|nr:DNA-binding transcriptional regulator, MarR family [Lentzea xinjiangensis]
MNTNAYRRGMTASTSAHTEEPDLLASDFPVSFAIFALARQHRGLASSLLADLGLFPGQELILMQLRDRDGRSQKQLVDALKLDHSTIAKSVRRLENAGLVTRAADEADARVKVVSLTETGRALQERIRNVWTELENTSNRGLTEQERALFVELAHKVVSRLP